MKANYRGKWPPGQQQQKSLWSKALSLTFANFLNDKYVNFLNNGNSGQHLFVSNTEALTYSYAPYDGSITFVLQEKETEALHG